jgi:AGZA family xanthine/uracil permease-like MFS transporter
VLSADTSTAAPSTLTRFDRFFGVTQRRSTYAREIRGGLVTFFTMAYIMVLNPLIIGSNKDVNGEYVGGVSDPAISMAMVGAATACAAGLLTIFMGLHGRFPIALAAGLGLNGFVAFTLAPQMSWPDAMGLVVISGALLLVLVLTGFRAAVFNAIPDALKYAIGVGIGLFLTIIALVDSGVVRPGAPLISLGVGGSLRGWPILTFTFGLVLTAILVVRKVPGALLIGIAATTVLAIVIESVANVGSRSPESPTGWALNIPELPSKLLSSPDLSLVGQFSLTGAFSAIGVLAAVLAVFSLLLSDFFDSMGTVFGLATEADLIQPDGDVPRFQQILVVDAIAASAGGAMSVSSNTSYIDSASGIGEGARTGIASLVTGALFLLAMFFTPLVTIVPSEAATPALVIVGFLMMTQVRHISFSDYSIGIPAFLTIVLMPFTYSIVNGIGAGMIAFVVLRVATGRAREVHALMWIISGSFALYFLIPAIESALGIM